MPGALANSSIGSKPEVKKVVEAPKVKAPIAQETKPKKAYKRKTKKVVEDE